MYVTDAGFHRARQMKQSTTCNIISVQLRLMIGHCNRTIHIQSTERYTLTQIREHTDALEQLSGDSCTEDLVSSKKISQFA